MAKAIERNSRKILQRLKSDGWKVVSVTVCIRKKIFRSAQRSKFTRRPVGKEKDVSSYFVIIHKDEDSSFGAYFPDLPGCFAAGDSQDQVLDSARISLRLYVEDLIEDGKPMRSPRSLDELTADPEVQEDLSGGHGFLMAVPLLYADKKRRVNVTLEPSLIAAIDEAARVAGTSRSDYLATAARREIEATTHAVYIDAPDPHRKVA